MTIRKTLGRRQGADPTPYVRDGWKRLRALVLGSHPICVACHMAPATHVDHIVPHRGDDRLFFDPANLQALCRSCHSSKTAKQDGRWGQPKSDIPMKGTTPDGLPTDRGHHWNR